MPGKQKQKVTKGSDIPLSDDHARPIGESGSLPSLPSQTHTAPGELGIPFDAEARSGSYASLSAREGVNRIGSPVLRSDRPQAIGEPQSHERGFWVEPEEDEGKDSWNVYAGLPFPRPSSGFTNSEEQDFKRSVVEYYQPPDGRPRSEVDVRAIAAELWIERINQRVRHFVVFGAPLGTYLREVDETPEQRQLARQQASAAFPASDSPHPPRTETPAFPAVREGVDGYSDQDREHGTTTRSSERALEETIWVNEPVSAPASWNTDPQPRKKPRVGRGPNSEA